MLRYERLGWGETFRHNILLNIAGIYCNVGNLIRLATAFVRIGVLCLIIC